MARTNELGRCENQFKFKFIVVALVVVVVVVIVVVDAEDEMAIRLERQCQTAEQIVKRKRAITLKVRDSSSPGMQS